MAGLRAGGLVFLAVVVIGGCGESGSDVPSKASSSPDVRAEVLGRAIKDLPTTIFVHLQRGDYELEGLSLDWEGDGTVDTVLVNPTCGPHFFEHVYHDIASLEARTEVWDNHGQRDALSVAVSTVMGNPPRVEMLCGDTVLAGDSCTMSFHLIAGDYVMNDPLISVSFGILRWIVRDPDAEFYSLEVSPRDGADTSLFAVYVWDDHQQNTIVPTVLIWGEGLYRYSLSVNPDSGRSPLVSAITVHHSPPSAFREAKLDWNGDGLWESDFVPLSDSTTVFRTFETGVYEVHAELVVGCDTIELTDNVTAVFGPTRGDTD